jgi:hypothetical protein
MTEYVPLDVPWSGASDFAGLQDNGSMLSITVGAKDGRKYCINFVDHAAYRKIDEGDAMRILSDVREHVKLGKNCFETRRSDFLAWLSDQSAGYADIHNIRGFLFILFDDVIEVLSLGAPEILAIG